MSEYKKRKRSRSRSREDRSSKRKKDKKFDLLQNQINNLTKIVETLVNVQKEQISPNPSPQEKFIDLGNSDEGGNEENNQNIDNAEEHILEELVENQKTSKDSILKVLGMDPSDCKFKKVIYHPELKNTWLKWKLEGLPEKNKKEILELYNRKDDFYFEAPKVNLEIVPLLSEIAKKRDQHFVDTQNCVGTAIAALGAAVSMLIDPPEDGLDENIFTDYISHAGQILTDVFHQQSVARKSFITPHLSKNVKPVVEAMISDGWLYGDNLKDKIKDVKEIEKACENIKIKMVHKTLAKTQFQGNSKYPPANYRQVGQYQQQKQLRFKKRTYKPQQNASKTFQMNQSSSKK